MNKQQVEHATNILANLIVNSPEVYDMVHKQVCSDLGWPADQDLSDKFDSDEEMESLYYRTGARYWSSLTHAAAAQLDPIDIKD